MTCRKIVESWSVTVYRDLLHRIEQDPRSLRMDCKFFVFVTELRVHGKGVQLLKLNPTQSILIKSEG